MSQIHEKSERLRDKLAAIRGWANPVNNIKGKIFFSDQYGLVSVCYEEGHTSIKTVMYYWQDFSSDGYSSLEVFDYAARQWKHIEFDLPRIEKVLDSIIRDLDQAIRNARQIKQLYNMRMNNHV